MPKSDQGVDSLRYRLIPRTLLFIFDGPRVLLIRGAPTKRLWANRYNGLGGHIEPGEGVLAAARRELAEEAGVEVNNLRLIGTLLVDTGEDTGIGIYILRGEYVSGELRPSAEGFLQWVDPDELDDLPLVEDLRILLPHVTAAAPARGPFSARSYYDSAERLCVVLED